MNELKQTALSEPICCVCWKEGCVAMLDQRLLPEQETYLRLETAQAVADAIRDMVVRGAPAIGIAAAYGVVLAAREAYQSDTKEWRRPFSKPSPKGWSRCTLTQGC